MNKLFRNVCLVALIGVASVSASAIDLAAAFGGTLISMDKSRVNVGVGSVSLTYYDVTGNAVTRGSGALVLPWGGKKLLIQLPIVVAKMGLVVRRTEVRVNGVIIDAKWDPELAGFLVDCDEYAKVFKAAATKVAVAGFTQADRRVLPVLNHEIVFVVADGERREYQVFLIFRGVANRDTHEATGFSLEFVNTGGWDPLGEASYLRPGAVMHQEIIDWSEQGVTGFKPHGVDPGRDALAARRNVQARDGNMTRVKVRYEQADGSLCRWLIPSETCLYWYIPSELVLTDTQLAVSPQHVPGQRYQLLPPGMEPKLPGHWNPAIKAQLVGMRVVKITRTVNTGAEINFEIPHGVLDLAPGFTRPQPDGSQVVLANYLVLGTAQSWTDGRPTIWQFEEGGDLVSFACRRPTEVVIRLRPATTAERAACVTPPSPQAEVVK